MNFSPDKFSYAFRPREQGVEIVLARLETGEEKVFYQAAARMDSLDSLKAHMNSLTDDLMMQWFQQRDRKPKKEKK